MRGVVMHQAGEVRVEDREDPRIVEQTDAIIRLTATYICGSDLWPYRGVEPVDNLPMGHEYVGIVEQVGDQVSTLKVGDFVVGSFVISDGTCEICRAGYPSKCVHAQFVHGAIGTQAQQARIPYADGTLVATPDQPDPDLVPSLLAASDVLGTGWFGAVAAEAGAGKTVAVVGDGAVGLMGVLAAKQLGADRIVAMSRHADRQALARQFGATDIVTERGDAGAAKVKELTGGLGAHSVIEAVGTQESMLQAIRSTRPGGHVGFVGVAHDVQLPGDELFFAEIHLHGGPAPVRRFLPGLIDLIWKGKSTLGRCSTSPSPRSAPGRAIRPWTSDARSRSCSPSDAAGTEPGRRLTQAAVAGVLSHWYLPLPTGAPSHIDIERHICHEPQLRLHRERRVHHRSQLRHGSGHRAGVRRGRRRGGPGRP